MISPSVFHHVFPCICRVQPNTGNGIDPANMLRAETGSTIQCPRCLTQHTVTFDHKRVSMWPCGHPTTCRCYLVVADGVIHAQFGDPVPIHFLSNLS